MDKKQKKQIEKKLNGKVGAILSEKQGMALLFLAEYDYRQHSDKDCKTTCANCRYCRPRDSKDDRPRCYHHSLAPFFFSTYDNGTCRGWGSETADL